MYGMIWYGMVWYVILCYVMLCYVMYVCIESLPPNTKRPPNTKNRRPSPVSENFRLANLSFN